jgi:hypothetical protein
MARAFHNAWTESKESCLAAQLFTRARKHDDEIDGEDRKQRGGPEKRRVYQPPRAPSKVELASIRPGVVHSRAASRCARTAANVNLAGAAGVD